MFIPEMARSLFRSFIGAIRGGSQYRKTTFLLDVAGQSVFPDFVQIEERPHIIKGLASSPFDGEGVATRDRQLVIDGVAQGYVLDSYSARKLGLKTTGNADGVHNLFIRSSQTGLSREGLLRTMGTGLLVTELMGQGVNAVTGDDCVERAASGSRMVQSPTPCTRSRSRAICATCSGASPRWVGMWITGAPCTPDRCSLAI